MNFKIPTKRHITCVISNTLSGHQTDLVLCYILTMLLTWNGVCILVRMTCDQCILDMSSTYSMCT